MSVHAVDIADAGCSAGLQQPVEFGPNPVYYQDQRGGCIEGMLMATIMLLCTILALRWIIGLVPPSFW